MAKIAVMNESERLEQIKKRLEKNEYFVHSMSDANVRDDMEYLLGLLAAKEHRISQLEKKSSLLAQQVAELSQEIENVKSDFGGMR